jgi:hypothetical protein
MLDPLQIKILIKWRSPHLEAGESLAGYLVALKK